MSKAALYFLSSLSSTHAPRAIAEDGFGDGLSPARRFKSSNASATGNSRRDGSFAGGLVSRSALGGIEIKSSVAAAAGVLYPRQ